MKKSKDLIPQIISASTKEEAVVVLNNVLETLNLSQNYHYLADLKSKLDARQKEFQNTVDKYRALSSPKSYESLHDIRMELGFLYQATNDELAYDINRLKIYHEERKTEARAAAMLDLKNDKDFQSKMKATSTSALRDILGASGIYQEFTVLASMSYGMYQEFLRIMDSMKMLSDGLASECRFAYEIEKKDAK